MATSPRYPTSEEMVVQKTKNMRVLIVGAGIGGMTLAALLKNRPFNLTLIERAPNFDHAGYMLGLWSLSKCNAGRRCRAVFLATVGCALGGVDASYCSGMPPLRFCRPPALAHRWPWSQRLYWRMSCHVQILTLWNTLCLFTSNVDETGSSAFKTIRAGWRGPCL